LERAGRLRSADAAQLRKQEESLRREARCQSNDRHVLALAIITGARTLATFDHDLAGDSETRRSLAVPEAASIKILRRTHICFATRRLVGCGRGQIAVDRRSDVFAVAQAGQPPYGTGCYHRYAKPHETTNAVHDRAVCAPERQSGHGGDGQVTLGQEVLKSSARKLRRLYNDKILAGFAGSTADAFALFARFESKLEQHNGNLARSVVELAKDWRTDKVLRHLEALLLVADLNSTYILSGSGDVIEPDDDAAAIAPAARSQGGRQRAAAEHQDGSPQDHRAVHGHRGEICIYTNDNITYEELG